MFAYQLSKSAPVMLCTRELFRQTLDSEQVVNLCNQIDHTVNGTTADGRDYAHQTAEERNERHDRAKPLKDRLPSFLFHATFKGSRRLKSNAQPSGLVMLDVDGMDSEPRDWFAQQAFSAKRLKELGIVYVHESPSRHGLHIVFWGQPDLDIPHNQAWLAGELGLKHDEGCKDLTRCSYAVPRSYTLYLDEGRLFGKPKSGRARKPKSKPPVPKERKGRAVKYSAEVRGEKFSEEVRGENPAPETEGKRFPDEYMGIPYADIIDKYWELYHGGHKPVRGNRNTLLFELACQLRYITDFNRDWLMQVIPSYEQFPDAEKADVIRNALNERKHTMPVRISAVLSSLRQEKQTESSHEEPTPPVRVQKDYARLLPPLPIGLHESIDGIAPEHVMPVLCGLLPLAGAYATQVSYVYCDGARHRLNLMSIIAGRQASNKSVTKQVVTFWKKAMKECDQRAREIEAEYNRKRKSRKANEKAPDDPQVIIREVPVTISCSTLLKRHKYAKGQHLYSFGEELDTLRKTNNGGSWANKYDLYREAFDNGEWGQDYNSEQAESGIVEVAYNWTLLGTYGALARIFRKEDVENGLCGRILFAQMPDNRFSPMPQHKQFTEAEEQRIQEAVKRLQQSSGCIDVPLLRQAMAQWCETQRELAVKTLDEVRDNFRKRAAVIGMRCGVIHHLLCGGQEECADSVQFALLMADYALEQQCELFGEDFKEQANLQESTYQSANKNVFDLLPAQFTFEDLQRLKGGSTSYSALRSALYRWKQAGWITSLGDNRWKKTG